MKITVIHDSVSLDCTQEELQELKNLIEFWAENNVSMDTAYEMISSLLRPKIVITTNHPG